MKNLLVAAASLLLTNACYADDRVTHGENCDPSVIYREGTCSQYTKLDIELNSEYRNLMKILDKANASKLKAAQRDWIRWRSERCDLAQEESGCISGSCVGVEHDSCILQLTFTRISELKNFSKDQKAAESSNFSFSKKTRFDQ